MADTTGKVAVVTGASRGLGRAIAVGLGRAGWSVVLAARSAEALAEAAAAVEAAGGRALAVPCDVGDRAQVEALAERAEAAFGPLTAWVNDAGVAGPYGPTVDLAPEAFEQVVRTNVMGTWHGSMAALHRMLPRRAGVLVNLLGRGDRQPVKFQNAYGSSKAWIRSFTLALAQEHADSGVRVHAVNPGLVLTDLVEDVAVIAGHEGDLKVFSTILALWGQTPERAARPIVALCTGARTRPVEVQALGLRRLLTGALRFGLGALAGRARRPTLRVRRLPPGETRGPAADLGERADAEG